MAEVAAETKYVKHNRHKLVLTLSSMRHFARSLRENGFQVHYRQLDDGVRCITDAVLSQIAVRDYAEILVTEPGEHRVMQLLTALDSRLEIDVRILPDTGFLCSIQEFAQWVEGRKQPRMEQFYRYMRKRHAVLLEDDGSPVGGRWNFDAENRSGWRGQVAIPERPWVEPDTVTSDVIAIVIRCFPENPGDLSQFGYAVTANDAKDQLDWFCEKCLPYFGTWQDGIAEESSWMFHGVISMYLNIGLLDARMVCAKVEHCWRDGDCELSAAEGFIRQVLGWREFVRGVYWTYMPSYAELNYFGAERSLPTWFWTGETDMRCLSAALRSSLESGYAHHIQRLMVIGNYALLSGFDVKEVCAWYLAVYVDAYEWVELPNTLGMALFADAGIMASKPYAASGKYIQRQGNHCKACCFDPAVSVGPEACPFNALYWSFIDRHAEKLNGNRRMTFAIANWRRRDQQSKEQVLRWADHLLSGQGST